MRSGLCVVVSPLISLMQDQVENFNRTVEAQLAGAGSQGPRAAYFNGSSSSGYRAEVFEMLRSKDERLKLLYVSPEGLLSDSNGLADAIFGEDGPDLALV